MSEIAKATVSNRIESAKRDVDDRPLWELEKDGALIISEELISQGSITAQMLTA